MLKVCKKKLSNIYDKRITKAIMRRSELESKYLKNRTIDKKLNSTNKIIFPANFIAKNEKNSIPVR